MFIQKSVADETISQYKLQGAKLVDALLKFIREEYSLSIDATDIQHGEDHQDESGDEADVVDDLLKIRKSKRGGEEDRKGDDNEHNSGGLLGRLRTTCASKGNLARPETCLLYTSPSPRDRQKSRMPSSA